MSLNSTQEPLYSIYIDRDAVRLYSDAEANSAQGRLLASQTDYSTACSFAFELANQKRLEFVNHVEQFI